MTSQQERKVRGRAYKFYDEVIFENLDWSSHDIATASFVAGAEYALANKHDELKEQSREIIKFLKDNGVYEMFWDNLANQNTQEQIIYYLKNYFGTSRTISEAFTWSRTQEGMCFWDGLSEKWQKLF